MRVNPLKTDNSRLCVVQANILAELQHLKDCGALIVLRPPVGGSVNRFHPPRLKTATGAGDQYWCYAVVHPGAETPRYIPKGTYIHHLGIKQIIWVITHPGTLQDTLAATGRTDETWLVPDLSCYAGYFEVEEVD